MSTLYEILEVSENASTEVIEKAYKVLAKKYHPDLQLPENKARAEVEMKKINEAYEILSDEYKRKNYDEELKQKREQREQIRYQNTNMNQTYSKQNENYNTSNYDNLQNEYENAKYKYEEELRKQQEQMQQNMEQQYQEAYYSYLRSLGFKIKERWTWKRVKELLLAILIMVIIGLILWVFPPTHKLIINFYESNPILKAIVDVIGNIFKSLVSTIKDIFV